MVQRIQAGARGRGIAFYARLDVRVERVITENALAYRKSTAFRTVFTAHGITQKSITGRGQYT